MYEDENDHEKITPFTPNKLVLEKIEENNKSPSLDKAADISPKTAGDDYIVKRESYLQTKVSLTRRTIQLLRR